MPQPTHDPAKSTGPGDSERNYHDPDLQLSFLSDVNTRMVVAAFIASLRLDFVTRLEIRASIDKPNLWMGQIADMSRLEEVCIADEASLARFLCIWMSWDTPSSPPSGQVEPSTYDNELDGEVPMEGSTDVFPRLRSLTISRVDFVAPSTTDESTPSKVVSSGISKSLVRALKQKWHLSREKLAEMKIEHSAINDEMVGMLRDSVGRVEWDGVEDPAWKRTSDLGW